MPLNAIRSKASSCLLPPERGGLVTLGETHTRFILTGFGRFDYQSFTSNHSWLSERGLVEKTESQNVEFNGTMTVQQMIDLVAFLQSHYKFVPPEAIN